MSNANFRQLPIFEHPSLFELNPEGQPDRVDLDQLDALKRKGFVIPNRHPEFPYTVYDYSDSAVKLQGTIQDRLIDHCRGLIVDDDGLVVARPFTRMEELGEKDELPEGSKIVMEKVDGTLGVQYNGPDGERLMASRRSFVGRHAVAGTEMLAQYVDYPFDPDVTNVWEIVTPETGLTVDYGNQRCITLLGRFVAATGAELPLPDPSEVPFPVVEIFDGEDFESAAAMRALDWPNAEGFVVRMDSGLHEGERFKVKFPSYRWMNMARKGEIQEHIRQKVMEGKSYHRIINRVPPNARSMMAEQVEIYRSQVDAALEPVMAPLRGEEVELTPKQQQVLNIMLGAGKRATAELLVKPENPRTKRPRSG